MVRRLIDVLASAVLLILSSPLFLITALAVWINDRGPIFFTQTRAGLLGRPFRMVKFRSMRLNDLPVESPVEIGEGEGNPLVTTVGRWIRRLKVDELPQLLNVLSGDMTFIGPRPPVMSDLETYTAFQRRRLEIAPGMTGWAQVNGGAEISWPERIVLEVWYVDHRSLALDLRILWRTLAVIFRGHKPNPRALEEAFEYAHELAGPAELGLSQSFLLAADGGVDVCDVAPKPVFPRPDVKFFTAQGEKLTCPQRFWSSRPIQTTKFWLPGGR